MLLKLTVHTNVQEVGFIEGQLKMTHTKNVPKRLKQRDIYKKRS